MKNKNLKVTVIVAAYNVEKFISKCIYSIIKQTHENLEIIIVDDFSKDNTGKICDDFMKEDKRIICLHHEVNKRQSGVRNTGLDSASGDFIVFVDGDDWLGNDFVEYLLELIVATNSDMAISSKNFTTRDFEQIKLDSIEIWTPEQATANFLYSTISIGVWNKIYRRDFIEAHNLRFKDLYTAEGFRFISDCSQRANQIAVGNRKVYYYRLNNANSATTLPNIKQGLGSLEALEGIENDLILKTVDIRKSILRHRFINMTYTLRIIIENKDKSKYKTIFNQCRSYIRKNGLKTAYIARSVSEKVHIILKTFFPVILIKNEIRKKNKSFKKDSLID